MKRVIASALLFAALIAPTATSASAAAAFGLLPSPPVPTASAEYRAGSSAFSRLFAIEVASVATGQPVLLTDQWRNDERPLMPFGRNKNQRCVIEFLRHFG